MKVGVLYPFHRCSTPQCSFPSQLQNFFMEGVLGEGVICWEVGAVVRGSKLHFRAVKMGKPPQPVKRNGREAS